MGIDVNPESIRAAAGGLDAYVSPDLEALAERMRQAYPIVWPGFGFALLPVEAYYSQVAEYHAENLRAGARAVEAMAGGLRQTADNYDRAEAVNVTNLLGTPGSGGQSVGYLTGLSKTSWNTSAPPPKANALENITQVVEYVAMTGGVLLAGACATISWPFGVVVVGAMGLMANLPSMIDAAMELAEIASDFGEPTIANFRSYTLGPTGATHEWQDSSVADFIRSAEVLAGELSQSKECIEALVAFLGAVVATLTGLWVALLAFLPAFFAAVSATAATGVGVPAAQAMGAVAAVGWTSTFAMVMAAIGGLVAVVAGIMSTVAGIQTMDGQDDNVPDLKQIKIGWTSDPADRPAG